MGNKKKQKNLYDTIQIISIFIFCALAVFFDFIKIPYSKDEFVSGKISKIIQQVCGATAAILLMLRLKIKLFGIPQGWLYILPCLVIALDNFPWIAYINGNIEIVRTSAKEISFFAFYCLAVGIFEELIFRGIIFSVFAGYFKKDRKGFIYSFIATSLVFGGIHIFNIVAGAGVVPTILQAGYSTLTGALFAFALIKTKNIFIPAFIHALYNFCGMIYTKDGLGASSMLDFDIGTIIMMTLISIAVGIYVLISVLKYKEEDRIDLYKKFAVTPTEKEE